VHVFRKHFLYEADEAWACEGAFLRLASLMSREETDGTVCNDAGPGFEFVDLPKPLGRVSCTFLALESSSRTLTRASSQLAVGICMDLNRACRSLPCLLVPQRRLAKLTPHTRTEAYLFQAAFDSFELASFCVRNHVDTLALPMAWLKPEAEDEEQASATSEAAEGQSEGELEQDARQAQHQAQQMIHYWLLRLTPLLEAPHRCVVACANRVGQEGGESPPLSFAPPPPFSPVSSRCMLGC
jgi:hypothetical protein